MEVIRESDIFNDDSAEVIEYENPKIIKTQQKGNDNMWQKAFQLSGGGGDT